MDGGTANSIPGTTRRQPNKKSEKPPVIFVENTNIKELLTILSKLDIPKDSFILKTYSQIFTNIFTQQMEIYRKIKDYLLTQGKFLFSNTPKSEKLKTRVLKGVESSHNDQEILQALNGMNIPQVTINKVTMKRKDNPDHPHFIVQISQDSVLYNLTRTKFVLNQRIWWEKKYQQDIFQCRKCQRIGHGSANCHLPYRCVKCAGTHEQGKCTIPANSDKKILKCANCDQMGHAASYRGCPY